MATVQSALPGRPPARRPLALHVGASKTGTSALQAGLFSSTAALAEQGVGLPLAGRDAHVRAVLRPLGWEATQGFTRPVSPRRLARLAGRIRATPGDRLVMSNEDLCEADVPRIRALLATLDAAQVDVHVVLSLRSLVAVLPSEWQQFLKHRVTLGYPDFLDRVRDREGPVARHFWQRQDALEIVGRWAEVIGPDHLDVVITPDRARDPDGLNRVFGEVCGYDPSSLSWPARDVNASWGYTEAEVYRRVNVALGDRLEHYVRDYQPAVRWPMVQDVLPRGASPRPGLPPAHVDWVREHALLTRDGLRSSGARLHGDVDSLVPPAEVGRALPELDEASVARVAVETVANLAVFKHTRAQAQRRAEENTPPQQPAPVRNRVLRSVRRRAGDAVARVRRR